jgi:hypothetical protein
VDELVDGLIAITQVESAAMQNRTAVVDASKAKDSYGERVLIGHLLINPKMRSM